MCNYLLVSILSQLFAAETKGIINKELLTRNYQGIYQMNELMNYQQGILSVPLEHI